MTCSHARGSLWLLAAIGTLGAIISVPACGSEFSGCKATLTCPQDDGDAGGTTAGGTTGGNNAEMSGGGTSGGGESGAATNAGSANVADAGETGMSGAAGSEACTNTDSDELNCGACGHSCLGGACSGGICQPLLLGTVPSAVDYARQTIIDGGKVYVFAQAGKGAPSNVWQTDANTPTEPTVMTPGGSVSCIMNGRLFWEHDASQDVAFDACLLSNCTATDMPLVHLGADVNQLGPGCDPASDEIVWVTTSANSSAKVIHRASSTGANARVITSFAFQNDGANWQILDNDLFANGNTDRIFYARVDSTPDSGSSSLYAVSTKIVNAAPVLLVTIPNVEIGGGSHAVLVNNSLVIASEYVPPSTYQAFSTPLPNGVVSGAPPPFLSGYVFGGVIDQAHFYGTISNSATIPMDAIVTCPLTACTKPTILARGQAAANYFNQDARAIYWTTNAQTSTQGFSIWKAAK
jgi:hypothetical protein